MKYSSLTRRYSILVFLFFVTGNFLLSQKYENVNPSQFFQRFEGKDDKIDLINKNWEQYFQEDIVEELIPGLEVFPIYFDSYGGLYPDFSLFKNFQIHNFAGGVKSDKSTDKYSMFKIFGLGENYQLLKKAINDLSNENDKYFYKKVLREYSLSPKKEKVKCALENKDITPCTIDFYEDWDSFHFKKTNTFFLNKIDSVNPTKIIFFIHGFNVPYSLAAIQAYEVTKKIRQEIEGHSKILLVPVFWTSNNQKNHDFSDLNNIDIKDEKSYSNGSKHFFYSSRAYYAGLGIRRIINELEDSGKKIPDLYVFSHSLGTSAATTLFINTTSKLDWKRWNTRNFKKYLIRFKCTNSGKKEIKINGKKIEKKISKKFPDNYMLVDKYNKIRLPKSKINVFLSAASMPGKSTFEDMCDEMKCSKFVFVGINSEDESLGKEFLSKKGLFVDRLSSTALGRNHEGDASVSKNTYFNKTDIGCENFILSDTMYHTPHNVFQYLSTKSYINLLHDFINH